MTNLEKLDNLLMYWKAKEEAAIRSGNYGLKAEFSKVILGLTLARGVLKEPSNTQMQSEEGPCSYCGTHDELETLNLCSECVEALPR